MRKVPDWHHWAMALAETVSTRSKDPITNVGSVILNSKHKVIGLGYNGFPAGEPESDSLWARPTKYEICIHSEDNAIRNCTEDTKGCTLYTTLFPCINCSRLIVAAGIIKVYYKDDKYYNQETIELFTKHNIKLKELK